MFDEYVVQQYGERSEFTLFQFSSRCESEFAGGKAEGVGEVLGHISLCSRCLAFSHVCFFCLSLHGLLFEVQHCQILIDVYLFLIQIFIDRSSIFGQFQNIFLEMKGF